ncbi:divergent PAP2 family protein [Hazenella sp. IB182357]|uniref:Divergent PAP2 family protein n=1 Tax=Polycladospora coralii TaxID=2771432 RepID=A0A926NCI3_9BACL|nr:divergent PAP2 family protein [Polycladospora coralii]MBD1370908.1 divergent PAP2 family protein [Polycladospora coralii]MBS7529847.1 divergent PAP2 family protein [Polycladospora coralii]
MLDQLLNNFPLWTALLAIFLAQFLKVPWNYTVSKKWDWNWILSSGGMPSGHTSAVTSLATSIGLTKGWDSSSFAIAMILGIIVMYDATGVRRQAGMHAQILNQLVNDFTTLVNELKNLKESPSKETTVKLKEILGHQPIEVFTGAWFGISIALLLYWIWYL